MRPLIAILILLLASAADAQQRAVRVNITTPGEYVIIVDSAGTITISVLPTIAVGGGVVPAPVPPTPVPPVVPPVVPSTKAAEVKAEVEKIPANDQRHQSALKLVAMYRFISANVRNGTIPKENIGQAVDGYLSYLLMGENRFGNVVAKIKGFLATCASPSSCADVLEECAAGILDSVPEPLRDENAEPVEIPDDMQALGADQELAAKSKAYGINWDNIFQLLLQLLPLILKLFAAVQVVLQVLV